MGAANLQYVTQVATDIGRHINQWVVVATKSTVPVGTSDKVRAALSTYARTEFSVASNPEFLKEGDAINDFMKPARVIVGVEDEQAGQVLSNLYAPFVRSRNRVMVMDVKSAELAKYAANAMLATRVSFMNEIALLAESLGADVEKVRAGIGSDPRIGPKFLYAGPGYGGSCFPKDLRALLHTAESVGARAQDCPGGQMTPTNGRRRSLLNACNSISRETSPASASRFGGWHSSQRPTISESLRLW